MILAIVSGASEYQIIFISGKKSKNTENSEKMRITKFLG